MIWFQKLSRLKNATYLKVKLVELALQARHKCIQRDDRYFQELHDKGQTYLNNLSSKTEEPRNHYSKLTVIVPFKDQWPLTRTCIQSLLKQKLDLPLKIILIDNNSCKSDTLAGIRELRQEVIGDFSSIEFEIRRDTSPFNFSAINNRVALNESPDSLILFLNNDTEFLASSTLNTLVSNYQSLHRPGALSCTLIYPSQRIQHLFLAPGVKIGGAHPYRGKSLAICNSKWFEQTQPVPAVTAALLMVDQRILNQVGGFDEMLAYSCQDLDLCLKIQKIGYINYTVPHEFVIHKESISRPTSFCQKELSYFYQKWGKYLVENPFMPINYSLWSEHPILAWREGPYPWLKILSTLNRPAPNGRSL